MEDCMGSLLFQDYIFEGRQPDLQKVFDYLTNQFTGASGIEWGEGKTNANSIQYKTQENETVLQVHIESRMFLMPQFKELAENRHVTIYYSCGSENGGHDTNDVEEKYFRWKPENLSGYGFRQFELVHECPDGTVERKKIGSRPYWTVQDAKEYVRHLGGKGFFCLSEAYADVSHDEIDMLVKKGNASIFEIYAKCAEILEYCDSQFPESFSVTNDRDGTYFKTESPVLYIEPENKETDVMHKSSAPLEEDDGELPF